MAYTPQPTNKVSRPSSMIRGIVNTTRALLHTTETVLNYSNNSQVNLSIKG